MSSKRILTKITRNAVISALYFLINILLEPISYGMLQFRVAEALTLLPLIFPESYVGLAIGCALSNIASPLGLYDVIFGSLITLGAGYLTSKISKPYLAPLPPILLNATLMPLVWILCGGESTYILQVAYILVSQSIITYLLGVPLIKCLDRIMPIDNRNTLT